MNRRAKVREAADIRPTPLDAGLTLTFTVSAYDTGMITAGRPLNHRGEDGEYDQAEGYAAAMAFFAEQLLELNRQSRERQGR